MVIDLLQFTGLFQACVLIINQVDQVFVVANDPQFAGRDVDLVKGDAVESEFLNLKVEGKLTPDKVFVLSFSDTRQAVLRRVELGSKCKFAFFGKCQGSIVILFQSQRVVFLKVADTMQRRCVDASCHTQVVVVDVLVG